MCVRLKHFFVHSHRGWAGGDAKVGDPWLNAASDQGDAGGSAEPGETAVEKLGAELSESRTHSRLHTVTPAPLVSHSDAAQRTFSSVFPSLREAAYYVKCRCSSEGHWCPTSAFGQRNVTFADCDQSGICRREPTLRDWRTNVLIRHGFILNSWSQAS